MCSCINVTSSSDRKCWITPLWHTCSVNGLTVILHNRIKPSGDIEFFLIGSKNRDPEIWAIDLSCQSCKSAGKRTICGHPIRPSQSDRFSVRNDSFLLNLYKSPWLRDRSSSRHCHT